MRAHLATSASEAIAPLPAGVADFAAARHLSEDPQKRPSGASRPTLHIIPRWLSVWCSRNSTVPCLIVAATFASSSSAGGFVGTFNLPPHST